MSNNPLLKKLGLSTNDRAVIFHADDIGMCHASFSAYVDLIEASIVSSASTMVPCGWFPATALYCRHKRKEKPDIDMGVHLTLTCEYTSMRWGPLSSRDSSTGLIDNEGYFFKTCSDFQKNADIGAVKDEMQAQINRALQAGIDVTHIDTHMGSVMPPPYGKEFIKTAIHYKIPALCMRPHTKFYNNAVGNNPSETVEKQLVALEMAGFPMLDDLFMMPLNKPQDRIETARTALGDLPAGVSYFIIHPSTDTPELRAITPDWESRVADYLLFLNSEWQKYVEQCGIRIISWMELRSIMNASTNDIKNFMKVIE